MPSRNAEWDAVVCDHHAVPHHAAPPVALQPTPAHVHRDAGHANPCTEGHAQCEQVVAAMVAVVVIVVVVLILAILGPWPAPRAPKLALLPIFAAPMLSMSSTMPPVVPMSLVVLVAPMLLVI